MTKEKLIQYCDLQNEIENLEKRIDRLEKQSAMIADVVQNGYKGRAKIYGYDEKRAEKLDKLKLILKDRYGMLLDLQTEIEIWISSINRSDLRQIFEYRYIDGMNWLQIMHAMRYKAEGTARMKHDRFLEKIF